MAPTITGFEQTSFTHGEETRPLYQRGEGPAVVVIHEVPGITPQVAAFGRRVADAGYSVFMPSLFGTPGKPFGPLYTGSQLLRACIVREFTVLATGQSSPITIWLRALCRHAHDTVGGKGVGVVGMCLTGNFALALMVDPWVMAPVLSQPSLPYTLGRKRKRDLHISDDDLAIVKRRACDEGVGVLGLRFSQDWMCPPERFERLREELGDGFEGIEIDSAHGNAHGISRMAHSVLARDLVDEEGHPTRAALDRVLALFAERLRE
jgi:dienelactone hydrolase